MITATSRARAGLYLRVSLQEQARHGFSIEGQLAELKQYCKDNQLDIQKIYVDAGKSGGKIAGRPELGRMLADSDQGKLDLVVIWRISRLSRNLVDLLAIVDRLKMNKVALYSLNEHLDTNTSLGQFALQMLGSAAELERATIAENVRSAMNQRSRDGFWNAGNTVLGYRWVRDLEMNSGYIEVVPEEVELVNRIYTWYSSGEMGLKAICNQLNQAGYLSKMKTPFSVHTVRSILNNPNYIGKIRFNKTESIRSRGSIPIGWSEGKHPAIITLELWNRVQSLLKKRFSEPLRLIERSFPLSGLLKCPSCGKSMIPWHTSRSRKNGACKTYFYYLCSAYNSCPAACRPNLISADKIEQWFFEQLQLLLANPEMLDKLVATMNQKQAEDTNLTGEEIQNTERLFKEASQQKESLFHSFESGQISKEEFALNMSQVKQQLKEAAALKSHISAVEEAATKRAKVLPEQVRTALSQLRHLLHFSSEEQQKRLLHLLVDKITMPINRDIHLATIHSSNALLNVKITTLSEETNHE